MQTATRRNSRSGFTLVELLMVSMLLFMLAYATFMSIRSTMAVKKSIDSRTEILQSGRALLELLDRDLRNTFYITAHDLGWAAETIDNEEIPDEGETPPDAAEPPPPPPVPITIFQATRSELLFSSRSHQRMSADSPENEQHYVRYRVEGNKFVREESLRVINKDDISDDAQFRSSVLIEDLKGIEFAFWNARSQRWDDRWDTNSSENLDTLPESVRVRLTYVPEAIEEGEDAVKEVKYETTVRIVQTVFKKGPVKAP